jgi:hypothetical protein
MGERGGHRLTIKKYVWFDGYVRRLRERDGKGYLCMANECV